ncbi:uncharacterized protein C17orf113-like [Engraulis encrasicolus]|uniref:uncharacterized protein C17orf113-like n=1 Tax=Engraulis encrasicolus TaxID=184585 RepID=UPI002FD249C4
MAKQMFLGQFFKKRSEDVPERNGSTAAASIAPATDKENDSAGDGQPAKKRKRTFKEEWTEQFRWLRHERVDGGTETMFCVICEKAGKANGFTKGSVNLKKSALVEHSESSDHKSAMALTPQQSAMKHHCELATKSRRDSLVAQMKVVYHMAKSDIPTHQFRGLTELLQSLEAPDFKCSANVYQHNQSLNDMEVAIEKTLIEELDYKLQQSEFLGLIVDETVNITVDKKLIVYLKFENNGKAETAFLGIYTIKAGMAQSIYSNVVDALKERGLDIHRVMGLGSDGASVMMGCHSGVGALLKKQSAFAVQVHCIAHRVALAASDASKAVQMVANYRRTVNSVYSFYKNSATRTNRLRELSATLSDEDMTSLKQQCAVRWLSLGKAVRAVQKNWPALIRELTEEAANGNAQSQGLLNQIRSYKFIALTHTLSDVLPVMDRLNLCFQREDVNLGCISPMVQASVAALTQLKGTPGAEEQGFHCAYMDGKFKDLTVTESSEKHVRTFNNRREQYIGELIESLERRFPRDDLDILKGFDLIFNPDRYPVSSEMQQYAQHAVKPLMEHYGTLKETETGAVEPLISPEIALRDVVPLMTAVRGYGGLNFLTACETVVRELGDMFPDWAKLAKIACTIPVSSVPAERGFSLQNRIKTSIRNRISEEKVTRLMRISSSGPGLKDFNFPRAAEHFHEMKLRRK